MKRRKFIQYSSLTLPGLLLYNCQAPNQDNSQGKNTVENFPLYEATVTDLQAKMSAGTLTARAITQLYLDRIKDIDQAGYQLNSVIEVNPDALAIADKLDQERKDGTLRSPLHGIPVMIKDNIDTADKMMTTAGSLALKGHIAQEDSFVAQQLRKAGAIILGKTNLSEWANFRSTNSSSGWSSRGGQTRNPYVLDRNPCGSSSGSGAAVSANLCVLTIGTETNGSVVCPSSANGVAGIKPTVGLISRSGIIPISHTQDTAGPMGRTLKDAAILLGILTGVDSKDPSTMNSQGKTFSDYVQFLDKDGLKGAKIGVARNAFGFHPDVDELIEEAIADMKKAGAIFVDLENVTANGIGNASYQVLLYEFKDGLNKYLANANAASGVKTLKDVIAFNQANAKEAMPYFQQEILELSESKGDLKEEEYLDSLEKMLKACREDGIDKVMAEHQLDAIIAPTGSAAWPTDLINGDHFTGGSSSPAARAGYPNITIPAGFIDGLPIGISFFGKAYSEPILLKIAYAYEQLSQHRKAPKFIQSLPLI